MCVSNTSQYPILSEIFIPFRQWHGSIGYITFMAFSCWLAVKDVLRHFKTSAERCDTRVRRNPSQLHSQCDFWNTLAWPWWLEVRRSRVSISTTRLSSGSICQAQTKIDQREHVHCLCWEKYCLAEKNEVHRLQSHTNFFKMYIFWKIQ